MHECFPNRHSLFPCIRGNLFFFIRHRCKNILFSNSFLIRAFVAISSFFVRHGCTKVFRTGTFFIRASVAIFLFCSPRMQEYLVFKFVFNSCIRGNFFFFCSPRIHEFSARRLSFNRLFQAIFFFFLFSGKMNVS